jgi:hypothetical protein
MRRTLLTLAILSSLGASLSGCVYRGHGRFHPYRSCRFHRC